MPDAAAAYHPLSRLLHWLTALFVLGMFPAGFVMTGEIARPVQDALYMFHKNLGVLILILVVVRLVTRLAAPPAALPPVMPAWQTRVAHLVHAALYLALIATAVTGYIRVVAGGFPLELWDAIGTPRLVPRSDQLARAASGWHDIAKSVLLVLVAAHVGAALYHGLIRRDGVLSRMLPALSR